MNIAVENHQKRIHLNPQPVILAAKKILRHEGIQRARLSIAFVTDRKIRALNKRYLKEDHSTDVLSFDLLFPRKNASVPPHKTKKPTEICGEIVICADTAVRQARSFFTSVDYEIILYLVHGLLHLMGYADYRSGDILKMRKKEEELMRLLDI